MLRVYADGGCIRENPSPYGGTYAFVHVRGEEVVLEKSGVICAKVLGVKGFVTNNVSELYALCFAILQIPEGEECMIYSDSDCTLGRVFKNNSRQGVPVWLSQMTNNARAHLRKLGKFQYDLLGGHPTLADLAAGKKAKNGLPCSEYNVMCDKACSREAKNFLLSLPVGDTE